MGKKLRLTNCIEHDTNCLTAVLCDVVQVEETVFLFFLYFLSRCRHARVFMSFYVISKRIKCKNSRRIRRSNRSSSGGGGGSSNRRTQGLVWPTRHSKASVIRNEATPVLRLTCTKMNFFFSLYHYLLSFISLFLLTKSYSNNLLSRFFFFFFSSSIRLYLDCYLLLDKCSKGEPFVRKLIE